MLPDIAEALRAGAANPWLFVPAAFLLGALHALEPGHAKSMMAAYIAAVRGTPWQAVLLGAAAAAGHTLVIWVLAVAGLWLGDRLILGRAEPWLVLAAGLSVAAIALRLLVQTAWPRTNAVLVQGHGDGHGPSDGCPRDQRHARLHGHHHAHDHAAAHIPSHTPGDAQDQGAGHGHGGEGDDAHAKAHAAHLERSLAGRTVTTAGLLWFGFTAGLLPCPAAFAVLLVCLQTGETGLGLGLVAAFSLGLAVTLAAIGAAAAWGAATAGRLLPGSSWLYRLPWISAVLILAAGVLLTGQGLHGLGVL